VEPVLRLAKANPTTILGSQGKILLE